MTSFVADVLVIREDEGALTFDVFDAPTNGPGNLPITVGYLIDLLSIYAEEDVAERVAGTPDPVDYQKPYTTVRITGVSKRNISSLTVAEVSNIIDSIAAAVSEAPPEETEGSPQVRPEPKTVKEFSREQINADATKEGQAWIIPHQSD